MVRRRWVKALVLLHPVATVFCIIVTANHFWLDAAGGLVILAAGFLAGRALALLLAVALHAAIVVAMVLRDRRLVAVERMHGTG